MTHVARGPDRDAGDTASQVQSTAVEVARLSEQIAGIFRLITSEHDLTDSKFVTFRTLVDQERARVELALAASDKAITKSEQSYDKRFELLNELRSGVATREQLEALEKRIVDLATRMDRSEGHGAGAKDNKAGIYGAIFAAVALITIFVFLASLITTK